MNTKNQINDPKHVVEQGYDQVANEYAHLEDGKEWPRMRWLKKMMGCLSPNSSILDLGCGSGIPADVEISEAHSVTGVDISQAQVSLAQQNIPKGFFIHGDAGSVVFQASSFDAVVSFYSLEHIPRGEHEIILQRIYQWLKPGGLLLISMEAGDYEGFFGKWLGVPMYMSCFDPETMNQLVQRVGFELLESTIESQVEQDHDIPYHWIFARKK
jgi:ubiquinone/menaquinone biosynthesis C-methylase UbiE